MDTGTNRTTEDRDAAVPRGGRPGKVLRCRDEAADDAGDSSPTYSTAVTSPCVRIPQQPSGYSITLRRRISSGVISNGNAVLGLSDLRPFAANPVMEGRAAMFKRFADIGIVGHSGVSRLSAGHRDHRRGRADQCATLDQLHPSRSKDDGQRRPAASIVCVDLLKKMGLPLGNVVLADARDVIWRGAGEGLNQSKLAHAVETKARSLAEALVGAGICFGLPVKDACDCAMVSAMADKPVIFTMANPNPNPDPEITPEDCAPALGRDHRHPRRTAILQQRLPRA